MRSFHGGENMNANQWRKMLFYICLMLIMNLGFAIEASAYEETPRDIEEISLGGGEVAHMYAMAVHEEQPDYIPQDESSDIFHP